MKEKRKWVNTCIHLVGFWPSQNKDIISTAKHAFLVNVSIIWIVQMLFHCESFHYHLSLIVCHHALLLLDIACMIHAVIMVLKMNKKITKSFKWQAAFNGYVTVCGSLTFTQVWLHFDFNCMAPLNIPSLNSFRQTRTPLLASVQPFCPTLVSSVSILVQCFGVILNSKVFGFNQLSNWSSA